MTEEEKTICELNSIVDQMARELEYHGVATCSSRIIKGEHYCSAMFYDLNSRCPIAEVRNTDECIFAEECHL